jgi:hypothetical protein
MWRGEVRPGRAGQAFEFDQPGVLDGTTGPDGIIIAGIHVTLKMQFTGRTLSFRPRDRPSEGGQPGVIRPRTPISRPATDSVRGSPGL